MKKLISIILSLILCCTTVYAEGKDFQVGASGAILMDLDSGRVLWGKEFVSSTCSSKHNQNHDSYFGPGNGKTR